MFAVEGQKYATVRFDDSHFSTTREQQRNTVVHELIHCQLAVYVYAVEKKTDKDSVLHMLMEYTVDALAAAFAPFVALPSEKL